MSNYSGAGPQQLAWLGHPAHWVTQDPLFLLQAAFVCQECCRHDPPGSPGPGDNTGTNKKRRKGESKADNNQTKL